MVWGNHCPGREFRPTAWHYLNHVDPNRSATKGNQTWRTVTTFAGWTGIFHGICLLRARTFRALFEWRIRKGSVIWSLLIRATKTRIGRLVPWQTFLTFGDTMKTFYSVAITLALVSCCTTTAPGQETELPKPGPEFDAFKPDVGSWDVEIKTWAGPGQPTVTKGKETNRMLGGFWLLSDFQGNMMGLDFRGHGVYSYDAEKKQYFGTWVDSLSPNKMDMTGSHDKANNTMTYTGMAPGPDGKPAKHILKTKYKDDGTRVMTMHIRWVKIW